MLTVHQEQAVHQVALLPWGRRDCSNKHHHHHHLDVIWVHRLALFSVFFALSACACSSLDSDEFTVTSISPPSFVSHRGLINQTIVLLFGSIIWEESRCSLMGAEPCKRNENSEWGAGISQQMHHHLARVLEEKAAAKIKQCMISADSSITEQNRSNQLHIDFTLASASTLSSLRCAFAPMFFLHTTLPCHGVVAAMIRKSRR